MQKGIGRARIRTGVIGFKVQCDNPYTTQPVSSGKYGPSRNIRRSVIPDTQLIESNYAFLVLQCSVGGSKRAINHFSRLSRSSAAAFRISCYTLNKTEIYVTLLCVWTFLENEYHHFQGTSQLHLAARLVNCWRIWPFRSQTFGLGNKFLFCSKRNSFLWNHNIRSRTWMITYLKPPY